LAIPAGESVNIADGAFVFVRQRLGNQERGDAEEVNHAEGTVEIEPEPSVVIVYCSGLGVCGPGQMAIVVAVFLYPLVVRVRSSVQCSAVCLC
jgi:hypothetical protein